jgi:arsenate reductase (thioredoxin)
MSTILFVCLHNAGRSQMSQALFDRAAAGRHTALSAGTTPGERVHLPDPKGRPIDEVRATRDEIAERVQQLIAELDAA